MTQFQQNPKRVLIGIILVAVGLRVAAALYLGNVVYPLPGIADQESYHALAQRVLGGYGFSFGEPWWPATPAGEPTAHWSFLYTLYLTAVYALAGVNPLVARLIQAVAVGILYPLLVYRLALRLFAAQPRPQPAAAKAPAAQTPAAELIGLAAAAITAVYVYFVYYAAALMTESFYILAIAWSVDRALQLAQAEQTAWRQWLLLGFALGITVLLRQLFLLFIPFMLLWIWWARRHNYPAQPARLPVQLAQLLLPLLVVAGLMLPWTARNYRAFGMIVPLNTNSGYAFYWGNHPIYGTRFVPILTANMGSYGDLLPPELLHLNEAELDSALLSLALQDVFADPGRYVLLSLSRIPPYFTFWPTAESGLLSNLSRVFSFGLFLPFFLFGLWRSLRARYASVGAWLAAPRTLVYLFMLVYTGIHVLTWTLIRYRLPVDLFLMLFGGLALAQLAGWLAARGWAPRRARGETIG